MGKPRLILQKPLSELIADEIRREIWEKKVSFGERLLETDLAERFDVSRSTIREALRLLEVEELVISEARKGSYVAKFSKQDIVEITELRTMIESRAFIHAIDYMEDSHFRELDKITEKMRIEVAKENWKGLFDLDMKFHSYVVNLSGNSRITKIYNSLQVQIRTVLMNLEQFYSSFQSFYDEHVDLLAGLKTKDSQIVESKIDKHIKYVEERLLSMNQFDNN